MSEETEKKGRGRPRKMDASHVLAVARQAYWTVDPADVSVNLICQKAGISKPSLYREFGSEDGLMRAALDSYAEEVLSDVFGLLQANGSLADTLDALVAYAADDPQMSAGCLYYKMRAGKHRLGPLTRARVDELTEAAVEAYVTYLEGRRAAGDLAEAVPVRATARYLVEQIGLALTQRASGEPRDEIAEGLNLAFSVLRRG